MSRKPLNGHSPVLMHKHPKPGSDTVQILLGTPTLGLVRAEWMGAYNSMVAPPNWALVRSTPLGYTVPTAQNMLVDQMLRGRFRALLLIEDDTCPPADALLGFDRWLHKMERRQAPPIVSGLYHIKGSAEVRQGKRGGIKLLGPEPLIYRGSGQRAFRDWKPGDVVWCSGVPTGALLIHRSVLEAWAREPDIETDTIPGYPWPVKRIFQNPSKVWIDPQSGAQKASVGTSDLWWSSHTIERDILTKAGWPKKFAQREFPMIVDTSLRFGHIDRNTGERTYMASPLTVRAYRRSLGRSQIQAGLGDFTGVLVFDASPDHATTVTSYELRLYAYASTLVDTLDIGKPTPDGNNDITYDCSDWFALQAPGNYTLTITALTLDSETESAGVDFSLPL